MNHDWELITTNNGHLRPSLLWVCKNCHWRIEVRDKNSKPGPRWKVHNTMTCKEYQTLEAMDKIHHD